MFVIGHLSGACCRGGCFCVAFIPRRGGRTPPLLFDGHHRLLQRTGADDARPKPDLHPKPKFLSLTAFVAQHGHVDDRWRQHHITLEDGACRGAVRAGKGHVKAQCSLLEGIGRNLKGDHGVLDAGFDLHRENTCCLTGPRHDEVAHGARAGIVCVSVGDVQTFRAVTDGPFKGRSLFIKQREGDGRCCVSNHEAATQTFFLGHGHDQVHVLKGQSVGQGQVPRGADQARIHGHFTEQLNVEEHRCAVFSFHAQQGSLEHTVVIQVRNARGDLRRRIAWKARERHTGGQGNTGPRRRVDASHVGSKPGARRIQHLHGTLQFDDRGGCTHVLDDGTKVKPAHGVH